MRFRVLFAALLLLTTGHAATSRPKVRAITAFVRVDNQHYPEQLAAAAATLAQAQKLYEKAGFEVQSVRITTQPFPQYIQGLTRPQALELLADMDRRARAGKYLLNVGPAMRSDDDDPASVQLLAEVMARPNAGLTGSTHIANERGIQWKVVRATAELIKYLADNSPRSQGNFNFNATAMLAPYTPFYNGSWHDGEGKRFAVGLQSANVVAEVFAKTSHQPAAANAMLRDELAVHAHAAEAVALEFAKASGWEYLGLDVTPAPLREVSIGTAIENYTGRPFGASGTMTAAAIITDAVKHVPVKQIGYAGLMLPVLEDAGIAKRWSEGTVNMDALLAYSSVCATGLDTVPLPGDVTPQQLEAILGDVASLAFKWKKPLTARLQPVKGKKAGDMTDFNDPYLVNAKIQALP